MTLTLADNPQETLTNQIWEQWKTTGYTEKQYSLTWLELKNLTGYFLKLCHEQNRDYREFDYQNLIDKNLNYYENTTIIENELGGLNSQTEKEAANKLKDYLTEEELKAYTPNEKNVIESLETSNKTLMKKVGQITKKLEAQQNQTIDPEALKHELDEMQKTQTQIYARLQNIPDLEQKISALLASQSFKDVGKALQPINPNIKEPDPEKPNKPKVSGLSAWLKKKQIKLLDAFAGATTFVCWSAATGWIIQSFGLTYASIIGLAVFWLGFIVVFRLMIGGLLD